MFQTTNQRSFVTGKSTSKCMIWLGTWEVPLWRWENLPLKYGPWDGFVYGKFVHRKPGKCWSKPRFPVFRCSRTNQSNEMKSSKSADYGLTYLRGTKITILNKLKHGFRAGTTGFPGEDFREDALPGVCGQVIFICLGRWMIRLKSSQCLEQMGYLRGQDSST